MSTETKTELEKINDVIDFWDEVHKLKMRSPDECWKKMRASLKAQTDELSQLSLKLTTK